MAEGIRVDQVEILLGRVVAAGIAPGCVGLAGRRSGGGRAWCAGRLAFGGEPVTPQALYDLASLTKPLVTTTLLLLALREGVELESPLGEFLPELSGSPWAGVSLAQCATHTAGFPAWTPLYAGGRRNREGYLEALVSVEPLAPAGERLEYSCLGFLALGVVLERGFGAPLGTLFAELVAEPLGVQEELVFRPQIGVQVAGGERDWLVEAAMLAQREIPAEPPPAASGTAPCGDGNARGLGGEGGNAGLFGTAAAVAALAMEYLPGGGELLTADEAAQATRCWTPGLSQARGLGWQLAATPGCSAGPALPPEAFGHVGFTGTSVWIDGSRELVAVLLTNRLHPGGRQPDLHPLRRRFNALAVTTLAPARAD